MSKEVKTALLVVFILVAIISIVNDVIPGVLKGPLSLRIPSVTRLQQSTTQETLEAAPPATPTPTPAPDTTPRILRIPKLDVDAGLEHVGLTESQHMDVPKNADNAAWYRFGSKPGELGNAVIAAHLDTPSGRPAVFYRLGQLDVGDVVEVESVGRVRSIFLVVGKELIPYDTFPNEYVFNKKAGRNLNLITCGGVWNASEKMYNKRLIVYTTLKEVITP